MNKNTPLLDQVDTTQQPKQSAAFKKTMHHRIEKWLLDDNKRQKTWLNNYIRKFLYAVPVAVAVVVISWLLWFGPSLDPATHDQTTQQFTTTNQPKTIVDEEMKEIIDLAFSFDTWTQDIKTAALWETDMIFAYLRK